MQLRWIPSARNLSLVERSDHKDAATSVGIWAAHRYFAKHSQLAIYQSFCDSAICQSFCDRPAVNMHAVAKVNDKVIATSGQYEEVEGNVYVTMP